MVCLCDCGNIKNLKYFDIKSGKVVSCGCYQKEQASKTGSTIGLNNYKNDYNTNEWIEIKGTFRTDNGEKQREKINIFKKNHKHTILYWEDTISICGLPYKAYKTYFTHANKLNMKIEDYLGKILYL